MAGGRGIGRLLRLQGRTLHREPLFGEGVGIAVRKEDADLRRAMDWALARLAARGAYAEIYTKYFPVGFYWA